MKTLYLHIGTPKTGTSALQSFLLSNSELLESRGACYRQMPWEYPRDASQRRNGHFLIGRVYDGSGNSDQEARASGMRCFGKITADCCSISANFVLSMGSL